jgi:hypothetical protein
MYGYLDAALHVKLSLGADAVMAGVSERYSGPVALAYLCTPVSPPPPMHQTDLSSLVLCCSWGSPVTRPSSMPEPRHAL